jgi:hypothetical protein
MNDFFYADGFHRYAPLRATDDDVRIYEDVERTLRSSSLSYAFNTQQPMKTQQLSFLRFCAVFGHAPYVATKGTSTRVLTHYII